MKKTNFYIGALLGVIFLVTSCNKAGSFLDQTATETLTQQKVFSDSTNTINFLNDIYKYLGQDIIPARQSYINSTTGNDQACLEELTTQSVSFYSAPQAAWITGTSTSANDPFGNYYGRYYTEIRACNMYMQNVKNAPLSAATIKRTTAEARFLRAWYYAELVRIYGGVMLVGDNPLPPDYSGDYKRNSYKECIDYIAGQCDTAAMNLPSVSNQSASDYGRITSGACLALKARMLLTAASPLFNGSPITADAQLEPLVSYSQAYDATLWQKAAEAFRALMNLNQYSLYVDNSIPGNGFRQLFLMRTNTEYILPYMAAPGQSGTNDLENFRFPISRSSNGGSSTPSQNLVDQFGMNNGLPITDPNSGYDSTHPYLNRDPRFYHTIIYNGASVYSSSTQKMDIVNIYDTQSSNGQLTPTTDGVQSYHTKTGYYCRKMADDSVSTGTGHDRVLPLIRYAEILLGYAEATNEYQGPTADVYNAVEQIRMRAGIAPGSANDYGLAPGMTKDQMRAVIQNEYRVEFAYEGHWFYDCRRWKIAATEEAKPIQGLRAIIQSNGSFVYTRFTVLNSVFVNPEMYFLPIPANEVFKSNDMLQNPGW